MLRRVWTTDREAPVLFISFGSPSIGHLARGFVMVICTLVVRNLDAPDTDARWCNLSSEWSLLQGHRLDSHAPVLSASLGWASYLTSPQSHFQCREETTSNYACF
jgi:hypothetical protein